MGTIQNFLVFPSNWRVRMPKHPPYHEQHGNDPDRVPWWRCMQVMKSSGYVDDGISRRGDKFPARLTIHLHVISSSTWNTRSAPTREVVWFLRHSTVGRRNQTPRDVRTDRTTIYGSPPLIRRVFGILELDCPLFRPNRISVARFPFRSWAIYGPLGSSRPITNLFLGYVG